MAKADLINFGGLVPKASARALPADAAQVALDLVPNTTEFRPALTDVQVLAASGVVNPASIYRMQRKADGTLNTNFADITTWRVSAIRKSFVKAQVNNDLTERTSVSFDDGSAPARMIDSAGGDRQLGVPAPTTAITLTLNVTDEFTNEERGGYLDNVMLYLKNTASFLVVPHFRPDTETPGYRPGLATSGYADRITIPGADPQEAEQLRLFRTGSVAGANNGAITNAYSGSSIDSFAWVFDASLNGFWKTAALTGWPTWAGTTNDHWCIPFHAYGLTYDINPALGATLTAMQRPSIGGVVLPLFTPAQVTEITGKIAEMSNQQWTDVQPKLNALKAKVTQTKVVLGGGAQASQLAAVTAFYAKTELTTLFTNAVANAAAAMWDRALMANRHVEYVAPAP